MIRKFFGRRSESKNQCVVPRMDNQKTFSKFVDKVIGDFPGVLPSKASSINPNNPYDVLQNKGLLNISRNSAQRGCCPSCMKLNLYAEESDRDGQTLKLFQSDHHFKNGKLIYSSTQELVPDHITEFKNSARLEVNERRAHSAGSGSRREYTRTSPSLKLCKAKDENHERYLHTLSSRNMHGQLCSPHNRNISPKNFKYIRSYQEPPKIRYPEKFQLVRTSSKVSVCSKDCYSSPTEHVVNVSHHEENRTKTMLSTRPPPRFRRDLFVKPEHTCRKNLPVELSKYESRKSSHFDTVRASDASPGFKHKMHRKVVDSTDEKGNLKRTVHSEISHFASPSEKHIKFSPHHEYRYVDVSPNPRQHMNRARRKDNSFYDKPKIVEPCYQVFAMHNIQGDKNNTLKHGIKEHSVEEPFVNETRIRERVVTTSDGECASEGSTMTLPFVPPTTDTERARDFEKNTHECREASEQRRLMDKKEAKIKQSSEKNPRGRRQIGPDKVVHFDDTGKRLSQHFTSGKATLDSNKVFAHEKKTCSNGGCSPKRSDGPNLPNGNSEHCEIPLTERSIEDYLRHMEGINDGKIHADIMKNIVNDEAFVEYREKYTKRFPSRKKAEEEECEWTVSVNKESSKKTYVPKHCEACDIERFWGD